MSRFARLIAKGSTGSKGPGCLLGALTIVIGGTLLVGAVFLVDIALGRRDAQRSPEDRPGQARYAVIREHAPGSDRPVPLSAFPNRLRVDDNGFIEPSRIHDAPDLTLVFLGGSTTEASVVKEDLRFPYLAGRNLERATGLRVNSLNGGVSGNESQHAFILLTTKVLAEHPDYVILMENINDLLVLMTYGKYWTNPIRPRIIPAKDAAFRWLQETLLEPGLLENVRARLAGAIDKRRNSTSDEWAEDRGRSAAADREAIIAAYSSSIESFITYCRAWRVEPVLMTQFHRLDDRSLDQSPDFETFLKGKGLTREEFVELHNALNERVRVLGSRFQAPVIDLARTVPRDREHIQDSIHLTDAGSVLVAEAIADAFATILKDRQPARSPRSAQ